jgi:plasmid stabilization system protein ParE
LEKYLAKRFYPFQTAAFVERIVVACEGLAAAPHRGIRHDGEAIELRSMGFESRVEIYFQVLPEEVVIVGVFYGGKLPDLHDLQLNR